MRTQDDTMFPFQTISSGAQLGLSGTVSHVGVDLFFWYRSRTMSVLDDCNVIFMLLCDVAIVSQLCTSFLIQYMGCVKITPLATLPTMRLCL